MHRIDGEYIKTRRTRTNLQYGDHNDRTALRNLEIREASTQLVVGLRSPLGLVATTYLEIVIRSNSSASQNGRGNVWYQGRRRLSKACRHSSNSPTHRYTSVKSRKRNAVGDKGEDEERQARVECDLKRLKAENLKSCQPAHRYSMAKQGSQPIPSTTNRGTQESDGAEWLLFWIKMEKSIREGSDILVSSWGKVSFGLET